MIWTRTGYRPHNVAMAQEAQLIADQVSNDILVGTIKTSNPTALVLMGLQYAGKSFLAERIAQQNYAHFWATKVKGSFGIANPEMVEVALEVMERVLGGGHNLIIDFVNHKHEIRKQFQNKAQQLECEYRVVFIDTPKQERLRRREENLSVGNQPGRRVITLEQMEEFEANFEYPAPDELCVALKNHRDIESFTASLVKPRG
jgi:predicted kinase